MCEMKLSFKAATVQTSCEERWFPLHVCSTAQHMLGKANWITPPARYSAWNWGNAYWWGGADIRLWCLNECRAALSNELAAFQLWAGLSSVANARHFAPLFLSLHASFHLMSYFCNGPSIWEVIVKCKSATNPQQSHLFWNRNVISK